MHFKNRVKQIEAVILDIYDIIIVTSRVKFQCVHMLNLLIWNRNISEWETQYISFVCLGDFFYFIFASASHYYDIIMSAMPSQITGISIVCSTLGSVGDQRKHQSSASLTLVRAIHRWPVNSPHKRPVTRKMFSIWWRHHDQPWQHDNDYVG